jgi:adenosylcobinamide-GDP ribazoletransferase
VPESAQRTRRRPLAGPVAALSFLTRLPVPRSAETSGSDVAAAAVLFPVVGAAIGALVGGTATLLEGPTAPLAAATVAVGLELVLTGALHVDGLADCADGLAGRDAARRLEIMRDHALGTYGAAALTIVLLAKVSALAALAEDGAVLPALAVYSLSRAAPLPLAAALPYARAGAGTGRSLADTLHVGAAIAGVGLAAAIAAGAVRLDALAPLAAFALVVGATGRYAHRALGGVTGDVMGAAIELTAALGLLVAVATG